MENHSQNQCERNTGKERRENTYKLKFLRKFLHSSSGLLALVFYLFPHEQNIFIFGLSVLIILSFVFDIIRLTFPHINEFVFKNFHFLFVERDKHKVNSAIFFYIGALVTVVLFPVNIAVIGILYLSIGDSAAAIGGIYLSKKIPFKIPKTQKTFIGSFSFFAVASVIGFLMGLPILTVFISAFTGALFEAVPIGIDDNFSIPLSSCSVIWLMSCAGSVFQKICY